MVSFPAKVWVKDLFPKNVFDGGGGKLFWADLWGECSTWGTNLNTVNLKFFPNQGGIFT